MDVGSQVSHYRLVRQIGEGGMGRVFLAEDMVLGRRVALKFVHGPDGTLPDSGRLLRREALAAAALDHPFICKIFESGETAEGPFIAMEYVEGRTLAERLAAGPFDLAGALRIATEVAEALDAAHRHGIVHRDLKPSNVMLTRDGHVKVMDFGVAKRLAFATSGTAATQSTVASGGGSPGTLPYMSPEQVLEQPLDGRSDLFAFGVLLYEMLSGVHPFRQETPIGTATAIVHDTPPPIARFQRNAPDALQRVIDRTLAKDPADRYESAHEVILNLRELSRPAVIRPSVPVQAPGLGWRIGAIVGALVGITALLAVAAYLFGSVRPALAFQERDWIVMADFENQTGDPAFDQALDRAIATAIQQSRYVNVLPRTRVNEAARRAGRPNAARIDETLASDVAIREGARAVLGCTIGRVGTSYVLGARIIDPATHLVVAASTIQAATKDRVLPALDQLATDVRKQLGESMAAISKQKTPLYRATTSSLEALKLYVDGVRMARGGEPAGYNLVREAIRLDPDFALAHSELGLHAYLNGERQLGEQHFTKALGLVDRLTLRERLWIQALVEDTRGNRESAVTAYKSYLAAYPDDLDGWFRMGWTLLATLDRPQEAAAAFTRVLEINPMSPGGHVNLATCYRALGRYDESLAQYQKGFEIRPQLVLERFVNHEYGFTLAAVGRIDEARATFEKLTSATDLGLQASSMRSLGLLELYRGRYAAGLERLSGAALMTRTAKQPLSELRNRLLLANAALTVGPRHRVNAEAAAIKSLIAHNKLDPWILGTAGVFYVRLGDFPAAREMQELVAAAAADRVASSAINRGTRGDERAARMLEGELALAQQRTDAAIVQFEVALRLNGSREPLARALLAAGREAEAGRVYEEYLRDLTIGEEEQEPWLRAHIALAKIRARAGDRNGARALLERLLAIWKDADPDLPPLREAQAALAALR